MEMKAVSIEEPSRLGAMLTGAILGCGGWVLSRGANDTGMVNMLFEFERQACVDIYSVLIAAGLELSQSGHIRFTELCQCTRSQCNGMRHGNSKRRFGDSDVSTGDDARGVRQKSCLSNCMEQTQLALQEVHRKAP